MDCTILEFTAGSLKKLFAIMSIIERVLLGRKNHRMLLMGGLHTCCRSFSPSFFGQFQVPDDSSLKLCSSPLMVDVV